MPVGADLTCSERRFGSAQILAFSHTETAMVIARERETDSDDHVADERQSAQRQAVPAERAERPHETELRRDKPSNEKNEKEEAKWNQVRDTVRKHPWAAAAGAGAAIVVLIGVVAWWLHARHFESTDDAFIDTRIATISSQVGGIVTDLAVTDNQEVDVGALLIKIDDRDYRTALARATAQVEQAAATVSNLADQIDEQNARITQAKFQVTEAQAALTFAQQEDTRAQNLLAEQSGTTQTAQHTSSDLRQARSSLAAAEANEAAAEKQIPVLRSQRDAAVGQLDQARAAENQAKINLARTEIPAPVAGRATKISVAKGNYAQPGQALMMFVPRTLWITANFKETQLTYMRPGQPVDIEIDAYPGRTFAGQVQSVQSGSGSAFSLLPAENATGNYVKVVQRVPVKIVFNAPPDVYIGPGMSVVPTVRVR
jgi:membrane fusion protein (multidrug efflux system)